MTVYHNKELGFSLDVPAVWKIQENGQAWPDLKVSPLIVSRPPIGDEEEVLPGMPCELTPENIVTWIEKAPQSLGLNAYFGRYLKYLQGKFAHRNGVYSFQLIESGDLSGGKVPGKYIIYSYNPGDCSGPIEDVVLLFSGKNMGYAFVCETYPKRFKKYLNLFLEIGRSFNPG